MSPAQLLILVLAAAQPAPEKPEDVEAVVVTAAPADEVRVSIDRRSYSVAREAVASTGTVADLLRTLPSVNVDAQGGVTLRGDAAVTITIDGKPAGMFAGQSRGQAVQSVPADQFERVEVITNPSAAESAEGSAGVINLISKTGRKAGLSGSARVSVGTLGQYAGGATLTYNTARLALNGDVSYRGGDPQIFRTVDVRRAVSPTGAETAHLVDTRYEGLGHTFSSRLGADYDLDARTRIGVQARHQAIGGNQPGREWRRDGNALGTVLSRRVIGASPFWNTDTEGSLSFRRKLGADQEFTADLRHDRATYSFGRVDRTVQDAPPAPDIFTHYVTDVATNTTGAKANYQRAFSGGDELKAGYDLRIDDNTYWTVVGRGPAPTALSLDRNLSGDFDYRQVVNAAFVTWSRKISDLTVLGGLRLEDARTSVAAAGGPAETTQRLRPFPSLHLSYALGSDRTLRGSYSRRVSRPSPFYLDPTVSYRSDRSIARGNPDLKPSETDSFEAGYEGKGKDSSITATFFLRRIHNDINWVTREIADGLLLNTPENLGLSRRTGASMSLNRKLTARLTATLDGDVYWAEVRGADAFGKTRSGFSGTARGTLSWQATPADLLQADVRATGRALTSQGEETGYTVVNLGYRRRLTPTLFAVVSAKDVTGGWRLAQTVRAPGLLYRQTLSGLPTTVTFGLTYNFGGKAAPPPAFDFGGGAPPS